MSTFSLVSLFHCWFSYNTNLFIVGTSRHAPLFTIQWKQIALCRTYCRVFSTSLVINEIIKRLFHPRIIQNAWNTATELHVLWFRTKIISNTNYIWKILNRFSISWFRQLSKHVIPLHGCLKDCTVCDEYNEHHASIHMKTRRYLFESQNASIQSMKTREGIYSRAKTVNKFFETYCPVLGESHFNQPSETSFSETGKSSSTTLQLCSIKWSKSPITLSICTSSNHVVPPRRWTRGTTGANRSGSIKGTNLRKKRVR